MQTVLALSVYVPRQLTRLRFLLLCICALLVVSATGPLALQYQIRDLGTFGGILSRAHDINDSGQIVGNYYSGSNTHAFLWQEGGPIQDVGILGDTYNQANGINNEGQVVGCSSSHSFLWQNGSLQNMDMLGDEPNEPCDINDNGLVVGNFSNHGFLWQSGSPIQNLSALIRAQDINNAGQVVGWSAGAGGQEHAILWHNGMAQDLGALGSTSSYAYAINNIGQVVGFSGNHAFLWENGSMQDLGTIGDTRSQAYGINDNGQVVGVLFDNDGGMGAEPSNAFVWQDGAMQVLDTLGGRYSRAYAINSNGLIVGYSTDAAGYEHAVLWEPIPEPSSLTALALGLLPLGATLARRRKRH